MIDYFNFLKVQDSISKIYYCTYNFTHIYSMSSAEIYRKNKAILNAGKIIPTIGTKIAGKKDAVIQSFLFFEINN